MRGDLSAIGLLIFKPKAFRELAEADARELAKPPRDSVKDLRTGLGMSFVVFAATLAFAGAASLIGIRLIGLVPRWLLANGQVVGAGFLLWATLAKQGWNIQTLNGNTLPERVDRLIFRVLYIAGTFVLALGTFWPADPGSQASALPPATGGQAVLQTLEPLVSIGTAVVVAVFTGLLWGVSREQAVISGRQADIAQRQAEATVREAEHERRRLTSEARRRAQPILESLGTLQTAIKESGIIGLHPNEYTKLRLRCVEQEHAVEAVLELLEWRDGEAPTDASRARHELSDAERHLARVEQEWERLNGEPAAMQRRSILGDAASYVGYAAVHLGRAVNLTPPSSVGTATRV